MRKIVQIACGSYGQHNEVGGYIKGYTIVLCDDGSVWSLDSVQDGWCRFPDIPQEAPHD